MRVFKWRRRYPDHDGESVYSFFLVEKGIDKWESPGVITPYPDVFGIITVLARYGPISLLKMFLKGEIAYEES